MNEKEIAEIRRRLKPEKNNITHVYGCYVNKERELVSQFDRPFVELPAEEREKLLALFKRTLSGSLGKNLFGIEFATKQVVDSEEHKLLMALRDTELQDPVYTEALFRKIAEAVQTDGEYLILLATEPYDVPLFTKDGNPDEDSAQMFRYVLCAVCPVKETKPALCYDIPGCTFRNQEHDWLVSPPELGFMFPAFEDRCANIYSALYYSRRTSDNHPEFADAVFKTEISEPADVQQETFETVLSESLDEQCSLDVVQTMHRRLAEMLAEHKEEKDPEPLQLSGGAVRSMLSSCGVEEERAAAFEEKFTEAFGEETTLYPQNMMDTKQFSMRTPDVVIKVNPQRSDLVETRVIDGARYILIRADEGVEVNGIDIRIS